jgi:hypothetical protein
MPAIAPPVAIAPPIAPAVAAAPALTAGSRACRVRLTPGPIAAVQARRQVKVAIAAWNVPVDADIAVLLTSDLVTHAIRHAGGAAITLGVRYTRDKLRVDVHDSARPVALPQCAEPAAAAREPGLALVARLSANCGCQQDAAGLAAYFTLALQRPQPLE